MNKVDLNSFSSTQIDLIMNSCFGPSFHIMVDMIDI